MVGFIIIGNKNAITYKEFFPYIKNNELWLGITNPDEYRLPNGEITQSVKGLCRWFTNIPHNRRNTELDLYKKYSAEDYPKYDNYNAIEVSRVENIPMDYDGVMGVPITFLDKYCPTQFEIVGIMSGAKGETFTNGNDGRAKFYLNDKGVYARILIRRKKNEEIVEYGKKFLIIGNKNAITYKEIFPYIKDNELWLGITNPDEYRLPNGEITQSVKGLCRWFTNIPHNRRNTELDLYKKYSAEDYPKYDNYNAIEVSRVESIPMEYEGIMGVPITFLYKYCPTQFEIIGQLNVGCFMDNNGWQGSNGKNMLLVNGKTAYKRVLIRRR